MSAQGLVHRCFSAGRTLKLSHSLCMAGTLVLHYRTLVCHVGTWSFIFFLLFNAMSFFKRYFPKCRSAQWTSMHGPLFKHHTKDIQYIHSAHYRVNTYFSIVTLCSCVVTVVLVILLFNSSRLKWIHTQDCNIMYTGMTLLLTKCITGPVEDHPVSELRWKCHCVRYFVHDKDLPHT